MKINIAIDGPAGSGKGTTAKLIAKKINYRYLDTGAMYRGVALYFSENNLDYSNFKKEWLVSITLSFLENGNLELNGIDVEDKIRTPEIGILASLVSNIVCIREFLTKQQKKIIRNKGFVLEGRDATTVIAPNAEIKIYLDCDIDERVRRRAKEFEQRGIHKTIEELKEEMQKRDKNDMDKGKFSLQISSDAIVIDTTNLTIDEQVDKIYKLVLDKV